MTDHTLDHDPETYVAMIKGRDDRIADLMIAINSLCLPPGVDDSPHERAKYTLACLRDAVSRTAEFESKLKFESDVLERSTQERDRLQQRIIDLERLVRAIAWAWGCMDGSETAKAVMQKSIDRAKRELTTTIEKCAR